MKRELEGQVIELKDLMKILSILEKIEEAQREEGNETMLTKD
jgi:hypothetical protein